MKINRLITILFLLIGFLSSAQSVTLLDCDYAIAKGSGPSGKPSLTYSIPTGSNRMMVIMVNVERDHRPTPYGDNYPGDDVIHVPNLSVGGQTLYGTNNFYTATGYWNSSSDAYNWPIAEHTNSIFVYTMTEAQGLPTGSTTFNFSNYKNPLSAHDEISVTVLVYGNVSPSSPFETLKFGYKDLIPSGTALLTMDANNAPSVPLGRVNADVQLVSFFGLSTESTMNSISASGWSQQFWTSVNNIVSGGDFAASGYSESDGVSSRIHHQNYAGGIPSISYTRSTNTTTKLQGAVGMIYALKPIAKPGISGTVYRDNNGFPINGGGTGGGVYNSSSPNVLYVNVLNATGATVVARATVNASGLFNIPAGTLVEGTTYVLQLSKNQGTIGSSAPAKELHTNWTTVGESSTGGGTDGNPNGLLTITLDNTNSTDNRFGVTETACVPPTINTQPPTTANYCQGSTATALSVTATGATSYQWYRNTTGIPSGGTAIGTDSPNYIPLTTAANVGTFYYYVVVTNGTCSTTSTVTAVTVTAKPSTPVASGSTLSNSCPVETVDLTTLQPAAVTGQTYEWHTVATNPTAGTKVSNATAVSVSGNYYLYSKTNSGGCFSNSSNAVNVTITPCATCTNSGVTSVDLNSLYSGTFPTGVVLEWWTSPTRDNAPSPGTKILNPTTVSVSGTYYVFFYDTANLCYNTNNSTAAVTVNILSPCPSSTCTKPGDFTQNGTPTKVGITVQQKQSAWPENIPNGFIALESKEKGFVITRVQNSGSIADPKDGMLIYDKDANCVKLYNGTIWKCIAKSCNE